MKILHEPQATVGQIVADLDLITSNYPECIFGFSDWNGNDNCISEIGVIAKEDLSGEYDLVVLGTSCDEDDAMTASSIYDMMEAMPASAKVVVGYGSYLLNLSEDNGYFLHIDPILEDGYFACGECDIRLMTMPELQKDMARFEEKYPDRRVVVLGKNGKVIYLNRIYDDDNQCFMDRVKSNVWDVTVSLFMETELYREAGVVVIDRDRYGSVFGDSIAVEDDGTIFFEYKVGDEEVIACRYGEVLYDNDEGKSSWRDMCGLSDEDDDEE